MFIDFHLYLCILAILKKLISDHLEVISERTKLKALIQITQNGFVKVVQMVNISIGPLGGRLGNNKIEHQNDTHQTTENIIQIARNGSVKVVHMVSSWILAWLFKVKLTSAKMIIKAHLAHVFEKWRSSRKEQN